MDILISDVGKNCFSFSSMSEREVRSLSVSEVDGLSLEESEADFCSVLIVSNCSDKHFPSQVLDWLLANFFALKRVSSLKNLLTP